MKIIGIGTDIIQVNKLASLQGKWDDPFFLKVFTQKERECASFRKDPLHYYASRFSGKEAVFKTLHMDPNQARLNEIEITNRDNGEPQVTLYGAISDWAISLGILEIQLSLSYDTEYAIAYAIAVGQ